MDSDEDFDWEEVQVPEHEQHIEITLQLNRKAEAPSKLVTGSFHIYLALTGGQKEDNGHLVCGAPITDRLPQTPYACFARERTRP